MSLVGSNNALFQDVPAGTHTLRMVAENTKSDRLVFKIKIYVSGNDTSQCAVNLINNRITIHEDNSVVVHFQGTNSADRFTCTLNNQAPFECKYLLL